MAYSFKGELSRKKKILLSTSPFVLILLFWVLLTFYGIVRPLFLPSPLETFKQTFSLFQNHDFLGDILASLSRIFTGFFISAVLAVPLGVLAGSFRVCDAIIIPLMSFIRYMPSSAFIPLVILWFGIGFLEKVIVVFISIFFYLVLLVADATANVRRELIETALTLGASRVQTVNKVIIPAALPDIWNALRIMLGVGWTMIVVVEMVAAQNGIGAMIIHAQRFLQTPKVIAGIIVIGILGILSDVLFRVSHKLFFPWVER
ncbi:MAG: ABC transporter permease [Thermodesulfobacteriota bacterium]